MDTAGLLENGSNMTGAQANRSIEYNVGVRSAGIQVLWAQFPDMIYVVLFCALTGLIILAGRLRRRLGLWLLAVTCLSAILLGTPVIKTWMFVAQSYLDTFANFGGTVSVIVRPGSGQEVLPGEVLEILSLMQARHIHTYRLSTQLQIDKDPVVYMRTVEASWPTRLEPDSPYVFSRLAEGPPAAGCTRMDRGKDIALDYCP